MNYKVNNYLKERWNGFKQYYVYMMKTHDADPAYPALNYIADRYELNIEQRYWLSYLYGLSYCVPTAFYMLNEFPDFENIDIRRVQNWWDKNKNKCLFQTDRQKVKSFNKVVPSIESYQKLITPFGTQQLAFSTHCQRTLEINYDKVFKFTSNIYYFGRFSLFNYLEALHELTSLQIQPTGLNLQEAESCRNGLLYACSRDDLVEKTLTQQQYSDFENNLQDLYSQLKRENPELPVNYWNIETVLCAYKKLFWEKRYLGYYIDRQQEEISKMQDLVQEGVDWQPLWDFRKEFFNNRLLGELNNWNGIRQQRMKYFNASGRLFPEVQEGFYEGLQWKHKVGFKNLIDIYRGKEINSINNSKVFKGVLSYSTM